jgi:hypothetical protein
MGADEQSIGINFDVNGWTVHGCYALYGLNRPLVKLLGPPRQKKACARKNWPRHPANPTYLESPPHPPLSPPVPRAAAAHLNFFCRRRTLPRDSLWRTFPKFPQRRARARTPKIPYRIVPLLLFHSTPRLPPLHLHRASPSHQAALPLHIRLCRRRIQTPPLQWSHHIHSPSHLNPSPAASLEVDGHKQQAVCGSTADATGNLLMGTVRSAFHCGLMTLLLLVLNVQALVLNWIGSEVIFHLAPFLQQIQCCPLSWPWLLHC